jgi:hypothetical protein
VSRYVVCTLCGGTGTHVNPAIDCGGLSAEDFADEDFRESYMRGDYDVPCVRCKGQRVLLAADLERIEAESAERARERRERAREDGDVEGYLGSHDPRWE